MSAANQNEARERIKRAHKAAAEKGRAEAFRLLLRAYDSAVEGVRDESMRSRPLGEYFDGTADQALVVARLEYENARAALELFACGASNRAGGV